MKSNSAGVIFSIQVQTPGGVKEFIIQGTEFIVGRNKDCTVAMNEPSLSRQHLRVTWINGKTFVSDLGSSNGSFLQGKKLNPFEEVEFDGNSKIKLGNKETWLSFKIQSADLPQAKNHPEAKNPPIKKTEAASEVYQAPRAPQQSEVKKAPLQADEELILQEIAKRKAIHEKDFQEWLMHQKEKQELERVRLKEELDVFKKEKMSELDLREIDLEKKYAELKSREKELTFEFEVKSKEFESTRQEFEQQKANLIFDAEAQGEIEYQRRYKEAQMLLQDTEKKSHLLLQDARNEALAIKKKAEEDLKAELLKIREKSDSLRQQLEKELKEIRDTSQKEQEGYIHSAKEQASQILSEAERKKNQILTNAQEREKNVAKECDEIIEKSKNEAMKKAESLFEDILKKETKIKDLEAVLLKLEETKKMTEIDVDSHRQEIVRLQAEARSKKEQVEGLVKLEEKKNQILVECEGIRKSADEYMIQKKQETSDYLKEFENQLSLKKEKEEVVLHEFKDKIKKQIESEQLNFQNLLAQNKGRLAESLTQFLQVYFVENPHFDFKKPKSQEIESFKKLFHDNILKEIGEKSEQTISSDASVRKFPRFAVAAMSLLLALFIIPPFLPSPWSEKVSVVKFLDIEKSSERFIASLQEQREKKVQIQKVKQIFENYTVSVLLTEDFAASRKNEDFLKPWYQKAQKDFFKKFRVPEEKMIQVLAKETSLILGLQAIAEDAHPDYFSIAHQKMKALEQKTLSEMKEIIQNDLAFVEFLESSRTNYQRFYFRSASQQSL